MRFVIAAGASIATVAATGWAYQVRASARDRRRLAPPGRLVDAGGHRLHINVTGADHGGPTVVLEAGGMATSPMWALIQPAVADFARVVSYDRAGLGWSETGPRPRDARSVARELHAALHNAGQPAPYILVGASLGGAYAAVFADTFRSETAGLVLVDSVHPDQMQRLPAQVRRTLRGMALINRMLPALARVGLTHLIDITPVLLAGLPSKLPADAATHLRTFAHWPGHWTAIYDEVSVWDDSMEQMRVALSRLGDLPLTVLTAPDNPGLAILREPWLAMQRELASMSSSAKHYVVDGASHIDMATQPDPIRVIARGIRDLIDLVT